MSSNVSSNMCSNMSSKMSFTTESVTPRTSKRVTFAPLPDKDDDSLQAVVGGPTKVDDCTGFRDGYAPCEEYTLEDVESVLAELESLYAESELPLEMRKEAIGEMATGLASPGPIRGHGARSHTGRHSPYPAARSRTVNVPSTVDSQDCPSTPGTQYAISGRGSISRPGTPFGTVPSPASPVTKSKTRRPTEGERRKAQQAKQHGYVPKRSKTNPVSRKKQSLSVDTLLASSRCNSMASIGSTSGTALTKLQVESSDVAAYIAVWKNLKLKGLNPRDVGNDHPDFKWEWNPARHNFSLEDWDIPWEMRLDCVFDRRWLKTDILEALVPKDPAIQQYMVIVWLQLLSHLHKEWRVLKTTDRDDELKQKLDDILDIKQDEQFKAFFPLQDYLERWAIWRQMCAKDGEENVKHSRPQIFPSFNKWLEACGVARDLDHEATAKLKVALKLPGRAMEKEAMTNLHWARTELKKVVEERGSALPDYL